MYILMLLFTCISILNPFVDISIGRCVNEFGDGKEYNNEPYYNYINYNSEFIHENDIVITGFILNQYGECEYRIFDKVILRDTKVDVNWHPELAYYEDYEVMIK